MPELTHADVYANSRFAGLVERYHTWPVLRKQTVGEHTWQVMRIWWKIFGPMTAEESTFLLWHDAGELRSGDPPGMVKQENPMLKEAYDVLERDGLIRMGGPYQQDVSECTRLRAKICDLIDVWELALGEIMQGNRLAQPIFVWARETLSTMYTGKLALEDTGKVLDYLTQQDKFYGVKYDVRDISK